MKRVIVTGGTGFIGANLIRRLLSDGHDVHLLVRHDAKVWRIEEIRNNVCLHMVELDDAEGVLRVVREIKPDWVFHLAVHGAYSNQTSIPTMVQTNITGTVNLVQASLDTGFEAFINAGSSSEYGFKDHAPSELDWLDPNSHYAITKAFGTHFCRFTARCYQVPIITLRLYSVFGPYEEPQRLLPTLIVRGLDGALPPLVHPGIARDFVYIDDVLDACTSAASQANSAPIGAVYNVGTSVQTTLREVVDVARRLLPINSVPVWGTMPERLWDADIWVADIRKIDAELGWQPRHTFDQGFRMMVEWFRSHPAMEQAYRARLNIDACST